mgnify:CR=1 FL=1
MLGKDNEYLGDFVYGGIDGAITTLAIMAGAIGASLDPIVVIILGFANLAADGFSMGVSNYLSTRSQNDLLAVHNHEHPDWKNPTASALTTFGAFVVVGFMPLLPFLVAPLFLIVAMHTAIFSCVFGSIAFLTVGAIQGSITEKSKLWTAVRTFLIGGVAATLAFSVGHLLKIWLGQ